MMWQDNLVPRDEDPGNEVGEKNNSMCYKNIKEKEMQKRKEKTGSNMSRNEQIWK